MESIGSFLLDRVLKMNWLSDLLWEPVVALGLDPSSAWGGSVHFFLYDTIKITILLCVMIYLISYVQSHFPPERSRKIMGRFDGIGGNIMGALLGTVTPFCSCSSIPIFIGFRKLQKCYVDGNDTFPEKFRHFVEKDRRKIT